MQNSKILKRKLNFNLNILTELFVLKYAKIFIKIGSKIRKIHKLE